MKFVLDNDCPLNGRPVWGDGKVPCYSMLVGEAPGQEEARRGKPFVGKSGQELTMYLDRFAHMSRDNIYITNIVKVRPPENRDPEHEEIVWFEKYLLEELVAVNPVMIIAVGRISTAWFAKEPVVMEREHGMPFWFEHGYKGGGKHIVVPCYHPSYGLHNPRMMQYIAQDFEVVGRVLRKQVGVHETIVPSLATGFEVMVDKE